MTPTPPPRATAASAASGAAAVPSPPDSAAGSTTTSSDQTPLVLPSTQGRTAKTIDFRSVTWDDVTPPGDSDDDGGKPIGVMGLPWEMLSSKQLRTICSQLGIKGVKNAKMSIMVTKICAIYATRNVYHTTRQQQADDGAVVQEDAGATRKQVQCSFRLINILFSDDFAGAFATLGDVANRALLDTGRAANDEHFWVRFRAAFVEPHPDYDTLDFVSSDEVFSTQDHIDPGIIVPHDWKKLRTIWKGIQAEYKAALSRFTVSGTHDMSFYNFCYGKLDVYYLRKKLEGRPNLMPTVEADLPKDCALASDMQVNDVIVLPTPPSSKRQKISPGQQENSSGVMIAEAIRDLSASKKNSELSKQKGNIMADEATRRKDDQMYKKWERAQARLSRIYKELRNPELLSYKERKNLVADCKELTKRKKALSQALGMEVDDDDDDDSI